MKLANCQHCDTEFKIKSGTKGMFCSNKCSYLAQHAKKSLRISITKQTNVENYLQNPRYCKCGCGEIIPYDKQNNKFVSQSHAATFNNTGNIHSELSKKKRSIKQKSKFDPRTRVYSNICVNCSNTFFHTTKRQTCSPTCLSENSSKIGATLAAQNKNNFSTRVSNFKYKEVTINCDSKLECAAVIYLSDIKCATRIEKFRGILSFKDEEEKTRKFNPDIICYIDGITHIVEVKQVWNTTCNINSYNKYFKEKKQALEDYCIVNNFNYIWLDFNYDQRLKEIYNKNKKLFGP